MYSSAIYRNKKVHIEDFVSSCGEYNLQHNIYFVNGIGYITIGEYDKTVLFCYGNACQMQYLLGLAVQISKINKVKVILWDYPGYGISEGTPNETNIVESLHLIINKFNNINIVGNSIGCGVVLSYIAKYGDERINTVHLFSPFTSLHSVISSNSISEMFYDLTGTCFYRNYLNIKFVTKPLIVFSLVNDDVIPNENSKNLTSLLDNPIHHQIDNINFCHGNFLNCFLYKEINDRIKFI